MATTITIGENSTDDYSGAWDNQIDASDFGTNKDTQANVAVGHIESSSWWNSIFNFTGIPDLTGKTITDASVFLYREGGHWDTPIFTITLRQILREYGRTTSTWRSWVTGSEWTTYGALSAGNDMGSSDLVTLSVNNSNGWKEFTSSALIDFIQDVADGTISGCRFIFYDASTSGKYHIFTSAEGTNGNRPYLEITYEDAAPSDTYSGKGIMRGVGRGIMR